MKGKFFSMAGKYAMLMENRPGRDAIANAGGSEPGIKAWRDAAEGVSWRCTAHLSGTERAVHAERAWECSGLLCTTTKKPSERKNFCYLDNEVHGNELWSSLKSTCCRWDTATRNTNLVEFKRTQENKSRRPDHRTRRQMPRALSAHLQKSQNEEEASKNQNKEDKLFYCPLQDVRTQNRPYAMSRKTCKW